MWTALLTVLAASASARAFVVEEGAADLSALEQSPRWSAVGHPATGGRGLHDGLQVAVAAGFEETLALRATGAASPADIADVRAAIDAAFRAWESPVLRFEVAFDGPAERGVAGAEIDLFVVSASEPLLPTRTAFAVTAARAVSVTDRRLTNGTIGPGRALVGADILINTDAVAGAIEQAGRIFGRPFTRAEQLAALTRLVMHETGHALGLDHPNDAPTRNFDRDENPFNAIIVDPVRPLDGLHLSPVVDFDAIVSDRPVTLPDALLFTSLRNDDRGGRDVLYPPPAGPRRCTGAVQPADQECDDGNACNGRERCNLGLKTCLPGSALVCDDGDPCNGIERCAPGVGCQPGVPCVDGSRCTLDTCDETGCRHELDPTSCPVRQLPSALLSVGRVRPGSARRRLRIVVPGPLSLPDGTLLGAEALLAVSDGAGRVETYFLRRSGWRILMGRRGSRLVFRSRHDDACRVVVLREDRGLRASCFLGGGRPLAGGTPEIVLRVGVPATGAVFYCSPARAGSQGPPACPLVAQLAGIRG